LASLENETNVRFKQGAILKIWFQLLSSESGMSGFISATQRLIDRAMVPGHVVEVRGTTHGVIGDQYRLFCNYDSRELIDNALRIREEGGYDAFVIANSLDPALVELREMLDIPVLSFMEVCCFTACTMGDRFGVIGVNRKLMSWYRSIVRGYGLGSRLAAVEPMEVADTRSLDNGFTDPRFGDELQAQAIAAARRCIEQGAEVVFVGGPPGTLLAERKIFQVDGVPLLDTYTLLAKTAEMMVSMHRLTGVCVSRHLLYESPSSELIRKVGTAYGVDSLRNG
jgi:allantoin racemase